MNRYDLGKQLRTIIEERLTPLIDRDYRYLMMCDHQNVGDTLIMQGEFDYLSTLKNVRCKEFTTMWSFEKRHPIIPKEDLLIMRGSGSFGDIWPVAPNFWKFIINNYPDNPILFMPQTIYFNEEKHFIEMRDLLDSKNDITLCVRDLESYDIANKYFHCKSYLVPDMAFYMKRKDKARVQMHFQHNKSLIVKREDREQKSNSILDVHENEVDCTVSDWPTFNKVCFADYIKNWLFNKHLFRLYDVYVRFIYRNYIIYSGMHFLRPYHTVYATRMHAGILAFMMGKKVIFIDNNYGKLRRVYETWLKDVDDISIVV